MATTITGNAGGVLGDGQTWTTYTVGSTRVSGTLYTNSTGKPIQVMVGTNNTTNGTSATVNGVTVFSCGSATQYIAVVLTVPNGQTYSVTALTGLTTWAELR